MKVVKDGKRQVGYNVGILITMRDTLLIEAITFEKSLQERPQCTMELEASSISGILHSPPGE